MMTNNHPLTPIICRVKRFARNFKPELRVRAACSTGLYADGEAEKPLIHLQLDQDYALPLLKAAAILAGLVLLCRLCRTLFCRR